MTYLLRGAGASGALFTVTGSVANNATWSQDIYFFESGSAMVLTGLEFKMTFRADVNSDAADLTISTDDYLSIENDSSSVASILRIAVTNGVLSGYVGDYITDLASKDSSDVVTLWAHGVISFKRNPVSWS